MGLITINPNNGRQFADLKQTPIEELPKMLEDAKVAQKNWASKSFAQRSELLRAIALECEQNANDLGQLMHSEMGKPVEQAIGEVKAYCSGMGTSIKDMGLALKPAVDEFATGTTTVHYLPLGVAAIITPWNFPFGMPWTLLVPALLGGNAVLFKPSEICPQTALEMSKIFEKHLPKNTLQTIIGAKDHGVALVDQHVDLVAFVGSRNAGKAILKKASERATRVLLEMGGKDPMIVTPGANIEAAAKFAATASMRNTGQVCVSVERIYVHTDIAAEFVTALKANIEKISVGPENSSQADLLNLGPL